MKKINILKKNHQFEVIINNKQKVSNKHYTLYYMSDCELETFQIGISVGKKLGNAPLRNRQKRQNREIVSNLSNIKVMNYVLISKKSSLTLEYLEKEKAIKSLFERV